MILSQNFLFILGGGNLPGVIRHQLANAPGAVFRRSVLLTALLLHCHRSPEAIEVLLTYVVKSSALLARQGGVFIGQGAQARGSGSLNINDNVNGGNIKPCSIATP